MNIFILDNDPVKAARDQCNRHVVKMVLESAQLLCAAFPLGTTPYRHTHVNHPCSKWVRASSANYEWLMEHARELCIAYTPRYEKLHRSEAVIAGLGQPDLPNVGLPPFVQAMPDAYRNPMDPVAAYRNYYIGEKARFARWEPRAQQPAWWPSTPRGSTNIS